MPPRHLPALEVKPSGTYIVVDGIRYQVMKMVRAKEYV